MSCNSSTDSIQPTDLASSGCLETDCFRMKKIYDWVKILADKTALILIPVEDLSKIQEAVANGHTIDVVSMVPLSETTSNVTQVTRKTPTCACVSVRKNINLHITITDVTLGTTLSRFTRVVQLFDSLLVCFPEGMPESAIKPSINEIEVNSLSTVPVDGTIAFGIEICQDVTVELDVMVKLNVVDICSSRAGVSCIGSLECKTGKATFPTQCNADCVKWNGNKKFQCRVLHPTYIL